MRRNAARRAEARRWSASDPSGARSHVANPRKSERHERAEEKRDTNNELVTVNLIVRRVNHREGKKQRKKQQTERPENRMPDAPLDLAAQRDHGLPP